MISLKNKPNDFACTHSTRDCDCKACELHWDFLNIVVCYSGTILHPRKQVPDQEIHCLPILETTFITGFLFPCLEELSYCCNCIMGVAVKDLLPWELGILAPTLKSQPVQRLSGVCVNWSKDFYSCCWFLPVGHYLFSLLHHACCRVTQLLYQLMHLYKIYTVKH